MKKCSGVNQPGMFKKENRGQRENAREEVKECNEA
jgi:hypothetical protein